MVVRQDERRRVARQCLLHTSRGRSFSGQSLILMQSPCGSWQSGAAAWCRDMTAACDRHIVRAWVKKGDNRACKANAFCSGDRRYRGLQERRAGATAGRAWRAGAVVMTAAAGEFVTPTTFQALSGRTVRTDLWDAARKPPWDTSSWRAGRIWYWWRGQRRFPRAAGAWVG